MKKTDFYKKINRLKDDIRKLNNIICVYETTDSAKHLQNFESVGIDMVTSAEKIACDIRNTILSYNAVNKYELMNCVCKAQGIDIKNREYGYEIELPNIISKRKNRVNTPFIIEPVVHKIYEFAKTNSIKRLDDATVVFVYIYNNEGQRKRIFDYDNLETKQMLDVINSFFLVDDSSKYCNLFYTSGEGERDMTKIFIINNKIFRQKHCTSYFNTFFQNDVLV